MVNHLIKKWLLFISLFTASSAFAIPPHYPDLFSKGNRWFITAYDDSSFIHKQWATQGICFLPIGSSGSQARYLWYSYTFPNWRGLARQEGDQVFMHGDYSNGKGHDGIQWQLVTSTPHDEGFGHWQEWRHNSFFGKTIGWMNTKLRRSGKCKGFSSYQKYLREKPRDIEKIAERLANENKYIPYPLTDGGKELTDPSGYGFKNETKPSN